MPYFMLNVVGSFFPRDTQPGEVLRGKILRLFAKTPVQSRWSYKSALRSALSGRNGPCKFQQFLLSSYFFNVFIFDENSSSSLESRPWNFQMSVYIFISYYHTTRIMVGPVLMPLVGPLATFYSAIKIDDNFSSTGR